MEFFRAPVQVIFLAWVYEKGDRYLRGVLMFTLFILLESGLGNDSLDQKFFFFLCAIFFFFTIDINSLILDIYMMGLVRIVGWEHFQEMCRMGSAIA